MSRNDLQSVHFPTKIRTTQGKYLNEIQYGVTPQNGEVFPTGIWFEESCQCFMKDATATEGVFGFDFIATASGGEAFGGSGYLMYSNAGMGFNHYIF